KGGRGLRLPAGLPAVPFPGWRHGRGHGHLADLQGARGAAVNHGDVLCDSLAQSVRYRCGALQCRAQLPSARGEL
ncbi:unnamed protein product, partial [Effrenium voratum]